jgi:hypothetical protein
MMSRWLLAASLAFTACTSPRQIVLSIDTTSGVPCDIDRIRIVTRAATTTTFERSLIGARLPTTITLLDETAMGAFDLEISGLHGDDEVLRAAGPMQFSGRDETETVVLDSSCTAAAPCSLSTAMAAGVTSSTGARAACQYAASPALESFHDVCSVPGNTAVAINAGTGPIALALDSVLPGSGFQFYGRSIDKIWVSKDGYMSFTPDSPDPGGVLTPGALDRNITGVGAPPPRQSIMAFWDTLNFKDATNVAVGKVCYVVEGDGDNRQFRLTWKHACVTQPCTPPDDLNFTVTLEERSHRVVLNYGDMNASNPDRAHGINATVGLVHDAIGCSADECKLATGLCKDGVTPCGYSQVFTDTVQMPKVPDMQFVPIASP